MRVFGGGPSNKEIDRLVAVKMEELVWLPVTHDNSEFGMAMENLLSWAERYVKENDLSLWKASKVSGSIESILWSRVPGETGSIWRSKVRNRLLLE